MRAKVICRSVAILGLVLLFHGGCSVVNSPTTTTPDLTVGVSTPSPLQLNGTWSFDATVTNGGTVTAEPSTLEYLVNSVPTQVPVGGIGPGGSQTFTLSGNVSDLATAGGTYHITVVADAMNAVVETNEANNTAVATIRVIYPEIVIDTYDPNTAVQPVGPSTNMELWKVGDSSPIASDLAGASRPVSWPYKFGAYIDYTGGLAPGDYYVLVTAFSPGDDINYAIRVIATPSNSYAGWTFGTTVTEIASDQPSAGPPSTSETYQTMILNNSPNDHLNRNIKGDGISSSGVNWIKLTLP